MRLQSEERIQNLDAKNQKPCNGPAISADISGQCGEGGGGGGERGAFLTFCLFLTDRPTLGLPEYKLKVVNICKMHGTGGLEVVVL